MHDRARWMLPFIEDQLLDLRFWKWNVSPKHDFVLDAEIQLVAKIGKGQFGQVFLASLRRGRPRWVAVKYLKVSLVQSDEDYARNILRERFACRVVGAHAIPGVVQYIGFVEDLGNMGRGLIFELCADIEDVLSEANKKSKDFVAARYQDTETLEDWSNLVKSSLRSFVVHTDRRQWSASTIIKMLSNVALALDRVHELGFLHRDVAARNVLCDGKGNVRLADFGLAKFVNSSLEDHKQMEKYRKHLSPHHQYAIAWWAPECIGDDKVEAVFSTNSDVFAFGVLIWQCFSHHDPYYNVDNPDEIASRILAGERQDMGLLDADTPCALAALMQACWETDPKERPSAIDVANELTRIAASPPSPIQADVRSIQDQKPKWFDVSRMYMKLSPSRLREGTHTLADSGSFCYRQWEMQLRNVRHKAPPSFALSDTILSRFRPRRPYDVFLIHTGDQKQLEVATAKDIFALSGFECFFDYNMVTSEGSPTEMMRFALETCRHSIVFLSTAFLKRNDPVAELIFAFKRMLWLRKSGYWESLWVVLVDLSLSDYKKTVKSDPRLHELANLDLGADITCFEWSGGSSRFGTWPNLCNIVKAGIVEHDNDDAISKWEKFLENWDERGSSFPPSSSLYRKPSGVNEAA